MVWKIFAPRCCMPRVRACVCVCVCLSVCLPARVLGVTMLTVKCVNCDCRLMFEAMLALTLQLMTVAACGVVSRLGAFALSARADIARAAKQD